MNRIINYFGVKQLRRPASAKIMTTVLMLFCLTFSVMSNPAITGLEAIGVQQQSLTVSGIVIDATGEAVIGANIIVKGTTNGTVTDFDGKFTLSNVPTNGVLAVSYIGYLEQLINVNGQTVFNITLREDTQNLDEVVVVGYGVQKKVNLTGSVTTVKYDQELENRPITDASQALQGKVSGVWANQMTGNPGEDGATIRIRGYGSLGSSSRTTDPNPLVLIDGIEGKINEVDPNSIESITVLKDAASAAIYGSRAANGVILIETKKGEKDRITLTYNGYVGLQQQGRKMDIISNSADYMELWNEALTNTGGSPLFPDDVVQAFRTGTDPYKYPNTDFSQEIFRKAVTTQHTVSANIGSEKATTYLSMSYLNNQGIMHNTSSERFSLNLNNETTINKWLKVGARARMQRRINQEPAGTLEGTSGMSGINRALYMVANGHPFATPYLEDGKTFGASRAVYLSGDKAGEPIVDTRNPFPDLYNGEARTVNNLFRGNIFATITFMEGLTLTTQYSGQYTSNTRDMYNEAHYAYLDVNGGGMTKSLDYDMNIKNQRRINDEWYSTFFTNLNLYKTFNEIHDVSAMIGYQQEGLTKRYTEAIRYDPPKGDLHQVDAGTANIQGNGNRYEWRMISVFGRVNYALMGKYLVEANLRADASSRFAKGNRWGYFPSFSAGWRLSEESFMKDMGIFDNLKIRASWGKLGNQNTGSRNNNDYFPYLTVITQNYANSYNYNNTLAPGAAVTALVDPLITWETSTTTDIGLDIGVLNSRLNLEADYFDRKTTDILVELPLPYIMGGVTPPTENVGELYNRGFEFTLSWADRIPSSDLSYRISGNLSIINNKVTKFQGGKSADATYLKREGYSYNELYGYIWEGIYQSDAEASQHMHAMASPPKAGDLKYTDFNGDGRIDNNDMRSMGRTIPKYTFGLNASLTWKDFDLNLAFTGQGGYKLYNNNAWTQPLAVSGGPIFKRWYDRWTPENPSNTLPKMSINHSWLRDYASTFWVVDMLWLKLKNVQLGYNVPKHIVNKLSLQRLYVYLNASELYTWVTKDYEGFDPERDTMGNGYYHYPVPQTFTLGVNVTF